MLTRLATVVAVLSLLGSAAAQDRPATPGNPPRILIASSIDADGNLELVSYRTIYIGFDGSSYNNRSLRKVSLKDVKISTVSGKEMSVEAARELLAETETPILASSWKTPIPKFYRRLFSDDALLFVFPREAPLWKEIQDPSRPLGK